MVVIDKETKQPRTLLTEEDIFDYIRDNCGDDIADYVVTTVDGLHSTITELEGTVDSLEDELNIYYANNEDED